MSPAREHSYREIARYISVQYLGVPKLAKVRSTAGILNEEEGGHERGEGVT